MLISNNMHELQSLLLKKLPRLGELTFWCEVNTKNGIRIVNYIIPKDKRWDEMVVYCPFKWGVAESDYTSSIKNKIIGHPFTHADILEALGEDWAMTGDYQLLFFPRWHTSMVFWMDMWPQWIEKGITLPHDLSDLSLPEYEETRKQLIQLLTK